MTQITLKIDGMACSMCENHVCDVIRRNFDVKKVTASHKKGTAVILTEAEIAEAKLISAIGETGYKVMEFEKSEAVKKKSLFGFRK
ncbi:MAG: cation transporter, partial [Ruminococcus sp.]|nr:cation transporter [Ruminococcus sp.]